MQAGIFFIYFHIFIIDAIWYVYVMCVRILIISVSCLNCNCRCCLQLAQTIFKSACLNSKQLICGPQRHQSAWINWAAAIDKRTMNPISSANWRQPAWKSRKCEPNYFSHCNLIDGSQVHKPYFLQNSHVTCLPRTIITQCNLFRYISIYIYIYITYFSGLLCSVIFCHNWVYQLTPMCAMVGSLTLTVLLYPTTIYKKEKLAYLYRERASARWWMHSYCHVLKKSYLPAICIRF